MLNRLPVQVPVLVLEKAWEREQAMNQEFGRA
jgi:hypothetical protein